MELAAEQREESETTWEEIERWSVDPERVPEPAWDSLEQCEEGYRRMELATQTRQHERHGEIGGVRRQT